MDPIRWTSKLSQRPSTTLSYNIILGTVHRQSIQPINVHRSNWLSSFLMVRPFYLRRHCLRSDWIPYHQRHDCHGLTQVLTLAHSPGAHPSLEVLHYDHIPPKAILYLRFRHSYSGLFTAIRLIITTTSRDAIDSSVIGFYFHPTAVPQRYDQPWPNVVVVYRFIGFPFNNKADDTASEVVRWMCWKKLGNHSNDTHSSQSYRVEKSPNRLM